MGDNMNPIMRRKNFLALGAVALFPIGFLCFFLILHEIGIYRMHLDTVEVIAAILSLAFWFIYIIVTIVAREKRKFCIMVPVATLLSLWICILGVRAFRILLMNEKDRLSNWNTSMIPKTLIFEILPILLTVLVMWAYLAFWISTHRTKHFLLAASIITFSVSVSLMIVKIYSLIVYFFGDNSLVNIYRPQSFSIQWSVMMLLDDFLAFFYPVFLYLPILLLSISLDVKDKHANKN
jgi:hypothetical protein